jgi:GNAT superfamily N-acetyltransferase
LTLRRANPADTGALRAMMRESNGYPTPEGRTMIGRFADGWAVPEADHEIWLLETVGGPPQGFYQLIGEGLELDLFFTDNAAQGRGVGGRLYSHMKQRAQQLGVAQVSISSNPAAADFYRRQGAVETGVTPPGKGIAWTRPRFIVPLGTL